MSNIVNRGLGQPGEGALVAGGLTVGNGVADDSLEATCIANGIVVCELEGGRVPSVGRPPGSGAPIKAVRFIDLDPGELLVTARVDADLSLISDVDVLLPAAAMATAGIDVMTDMEAVVSASAAAAATQVRTQDEAAMVLLLM